MRPTNQQLVELTTETVRVYLVALGPLSTDDKFIVLTALKHRVLFQMMRLEQGSEPKPAGETAH